MRQTIPPAVHPRCHRRLASSRSAGIDSEKSMETKSKTNLEKYSSDKKTSFWKKIRKILQELQNTKRCLSLTLMSFRFSNSSFGAGGRSSSSLPQKLPLRLAGPDAPSSSFWITILLRRSMTFWVLDVRNPTPESERAEFRLGRWKETAWGML